MSIHEQNPLPKRVLSLEDIVALDAIMATTIGGERVVISEVPSMAPEFEDQYTDGEDADL